MSKITIFNLQVLRIMDSVRISIVDDHHLFREGIKHILINTRNYKVVAEFMNGIDFVNDLPNIETDIILMDIEMPGMDGLEATKKALQLNPDLRILILSSYSEPGYYHSMVEAGVRGFLLKNSTSDELLKAIADVVAGETYFSQDLLRKIIYNYGAEAACKVKTKYLKEELSERELEVLQYLCKGLTNAEIADKIFISQRTVEGHRANLLKKTNTKNTVQLIMFAIKNELISV